MTYILDIDAVDGDTSIRIHSRSKQTILFYLEKLDHEGSSLRLEIKGIHGTLTVMNHSEKIYEELNR